jgi:hypothetical protein
MSGAGDSALIDTEALAAGDVDDVATQLRQGDLATRLEILRQQLGLAKPPVYRTVTIPVARLVVLDEAHVGRRGRSMALNIGLMGVLNPVAIVPMPGTETFRVVAGRGRVLGARLIGEPAALEVHLYARLTPVEELFLILSEKLRRAPAWVQEVQALAELLARRIGIREQVLAYALDLTIGQVRERRKIAELPPALLAQIYAGSLNQAMAKQIARLQAPQRRALEERAEDGETITKDLVRQALHGQIGAGMAAISRAFDPTWTPWGQGQRAPTSSPAAGAPRIEDAASGSSSAPRVFGLAELDALQAALRTAEPGLLDLPGATSASLLLRAFTQELGILRRQLA